MSLRNKISLSNFFTGILVVFVLAMLFSPSFKGVVMQNLMKIGLFQPSIPDGPTVEVAAEINTATHNREILFKNMNDEVIELSDQKGKVVFINFWATWCPPCIAEMPTINKLYSSFRDNENVMFMMVDVDNDPIKSQKFMDKRKFDLPVYTPASPIPSSYMGGAIPTTLVLNKYGQVVFKHEGMGDFSNAEFKDFVNQLIEE
ncbi:TlpA disulfide reductase family protein [Albibacterium sp.]|uniref:TlpA family protein disulfide reductase n=1 Tax=Albibacterium sp. TaxID=2952885 RepID=UPI002D082328|nr:TlpA disulfide reductase family protein [Albibacterium sp.]HUH19619.1 TlpA disulfide reductase family protein [Albibacterium sp.]